jgi:hypothetical protein
MVSFMSAKLWPAYDPLPPSAATMEDGYAAVLSFAWKPGSK